MNESNLNYIYNYEKIKHVVSQLKPELLELTPDIIYRDNKHILCYAQVLINVKYNKLQNYRKYVKQLIGLLVDTNSNKNKYLLEILLQEIDECITILEPLKLMFQPLLQDILLLDIELEINDN